MKYAGPVAGSLGLSLEETAAAIGIMSDAGVKGSNAGTALRSSLTRLANPTAQAKQVMDELGLSFFDSEGKMKSLSDITGQLQNAFRGLTDEQKQQAISALFGQQATSGMLALVNSAPGSLEAMTSSLENADGAAKEMADTINGGLPGAIEEMKGAFETAQITVTSLLTPALEQGANKVAELLDAFNNADAGAQSFIGGIAAVAVAMGPALQFTAAYINTLVLLKNNINSLVSNNPLANYFKKTSSAIKETIPSFSQVMSRLSGIGSKVKSMGGGLFVIPLL